MRQLEATSLDNTTSDPAKALLPIRAFTTYRKQLSRIHTTNTSNTNNAVNLPTRNHTTRPAGRCGLCMIRLFVGLYLPFDGTTL